GVRGQAVVTAIEPCPLRPAGPGRRVTGTFKHSRGRVWGFHVGGERTPIGGTATHPVWVGGRDGWGPAGELRLGERLLARDGSRPRVESLTPRREPEPVYNIEVEGDHCYRVGEQGLLVHNSSVPTSADLKSIARMFRQSKGWTDGKKNL